MSAKLKAINSIEKLNTEELADLLDTHGFPEVNDKLRQNNIDGKNFFGLQDSDIRNWNIHRVKAVRFSSFFLRIKEHPEEFLITTNEPKKIIKPVQTFKTNTPPSKNYSSYQNNLSKGTHDVPEDEEMAVYSNTPTIQDDKRKGFMVESPPPARPTKPKPKLFTQPVQNEIVEEEDAAYIDMRQNVQLSSSFSDEDGDGYLTPTEFESDEINEYEPPPGIRPSDLKQKVQKIDYKDIRIEINQNKMKINNSSTDLKNRPLPALPQGNRKPILPPKNIPNNEDENLADYIEVDETTVGKPQKSPISDSSNLHLLLHSELLQLTNSKKKTSLLKQSEISTNSLPRPPKNLPTQINTTNINKATNAVPKQFNKQTINAPKAPKPLPQQKNTTQINTRNISQFNKTNEGVKPKINTHKAMTTSVLPDKKPNVKSSNDLTSNIKKNSFYRDVDRKGAKLLLAGLQDGAFLIRPPKKSDFLCIFVVKSGEKFFNIGLENGPDNTLTIQSVGGVTKFNSINGIIDHFCINPLCVIDNDNIVEVYLKKVLR